METGSVRLRPPPTIRPEFAARLVLREVAVISVGCKRARSGSRAVASERLKWADSAPTRVASGKDRSRHNSRHFCRLNFDRTNRPVTCCRSSPLWSSWMTWPQ